MITNVNNDLAWKLGLPQRMQALRQSNVGVTSIQGVESMIRTLNLRYNRIDLKLSHLEGIALMRRAKIGLGSKTKKHTPGEPKYSKLKKPNLNFKKLASNEFAGNRSQASGEPPRGNKQK